MKHLKIYETFNNDNGTLEIQVSNNLVDLLGCSPDDFTPDYILYDYDEFNDVSYEDYEDDYQSEEEFEESKENHERAIDSLNTEAYWSYIVTFIQKWFNEEDVIDDLIDTLPFVKSVTFTKIELDKGYLFLDINIIVDPISMTIFTINLLNDSKFLNHISEMYNSQPGFTSNMPSTPSDIIEIIEKTSYDNYYKLLTIISSYCKHEYTQSDSNSLILYLNENIHKSVYDFQK